MSKSNDGQNIRSVEDQPQHGADTINADTFIKILSLVDRAMLVGTNGTKLGKCENGLKDEGQQKLENAVKLLLDGRLDKQEPDKNNSVFDIIERLKKIKALADGRDSREGSRNFHLAEAILRYKHIREVLKEEHNGGLYDAYILYVNLDDAKVPFQQLHHFRRALSLVFPPSESDFYTQTLKEIIDLPAFGSPAELQTHWDLWFEAAGDKYNPDDTPHPLARAILQLKNTDGYKDLSTKEALREALLDLKEPSTQPADNDKDLTRNSLIQRVILDDYVIRRRDQMRAWRQEFGEGSGEPSLNDISILRHASFLTISEIPDPTNHVSEEDYNNKLLLLEEGEIMLGVFLQRLAEAVWKPPECQIKEGKLFVKENQQWNLSDYYGDLERLLQNKNHLKKFKLFKTKEDGFLEPTNCLKATIDWLKVVSGYGHDKALSQLLIADIPKENKSSNLFFGFGLKNKLTNLNLLCDNFTKESTLENIISIFKLLFSANIIDDNPVPFTPVQLSYIMRVDPFVMQIQFAGIEAKINNTAEMDKEAHYYYFAMPLDPIDNNKSVSLELENDRNDRLFAMWLGFLKWGSRPDEKRNEDVLGRISRLRYILSTIGHPVARDVIERDLTTQRRLALQGQRQAAAASILSRNMSHNIGSHVLPRATIDALESKIRDFWSKAENRDSQQISEKKLRIMLRDSKQKIDDYIRVKSEFLAEITTEPSLSTRSLLFFKDILLPFLQNTVLFDTICGNEGFGYESYNEATLSIRCYRDRLTDWDEIYADFGDCERLVPYSGRIKEDWSTYKIPAIYNQEKDVRVALPGPVGEMAFYSILENILRNSAKHGGFRKEGENLKLDIVVREKNNDFFEILIIDRRSACAPEIIKELNSYLHADIITHDGEIRKKSWGSAEMAICAAFLEGKQDFSNDSSSIETKDLHAFKSLNISDTDPSCLVYRFSLKKAFSALMIEFSDSALYSKSMITSGIRSAKIEIDKDNDSISINNFNSEGYQFAVINGRAKCMENIDVKRLRRLFYQLPFRIIIVNGDGCLHEKFDKLCAFTSEAPPSDTYEKLVKWLWMTWLGNREWHTKVNKICLSLEQNRGEEPTRTYITHKTEGFNKEDVNNESAYQFEILTKDEIKDLRLLKNLLGSATDRFLMDRHSYIARNSLGIASKQMVWVDLDKYNPDFDNLFNPDLSKPWVLPFQLLEAARLRILLLDERIAQWAMNKADKNISYAVGLAEESTAHYWHSARRAGVWITTGIEIKNSSTSNTAITFCPKEKGLLLPSFNITINLHNEKISARENLGATDLKNAAIDLRSFDIAVIHQGILDSLEKSKKVAPQSFIRFLRKYLPWIVIESGRGIPPEVKEGKEKFLPFTVLDRGFSRGTVAKFELTHRLMELTRSRIKCRKRRI